MHGLDCRQLELFGKTHALLLQLAAGFADALSDLRARALILTAGRASRSDSRPTRHARVVERGRA